MPEEGRLPEVRIGVAVVVGGLRGERKVGEIDGIVDLGEDGEEELRKKGEWAIAEKDCTLGENDLPPMGSYVVEQTCCPPLCRVV